MAAIPAPVPGVRAARPSSISLSARASLFTAGILTLLGLLCGITLYAGEQSKAEQQVHESAFRIAAAIAEYAKEDLSDAASLQQTITRGAHWRNVDRVAFYDAAGTLIMADGAAPIPEEAEALRASRARQSLIQAGMTAVSAAPVAENGVRFGAVVVTVRNPSAFAAAWQTMGGYIALIAAYVAMATALSIAFVRRAVAPLQQLTEFAERADTQQGGRALQVRTGDEFETLANAFNQMMERLDASTRRVRALAYIDATTQLPNHEFYTRELNRAITQSNPDAAPGALIIIDFGRLQKMLETLGPEASSNLLALVAHRLRSAVRMVDRLVRLQAAQSQPTFIARLRQHEFGLIAHSFAEEGDIARYAQLIASAVNQPFVWRDLKLSLDARCGAVRIGEDGRDADALTRNARLALQAARSTPTGVKFFTRALDLEVANRLQLENDMRSALERNEFHAFFQPKVNLADGRIMGAEALARWIRPDKTIVSPALFIPVAEECGLIGQVAEAVMREACWKAAAWAREGLAVQVAVNVSALQLRDDAFAEHIQKILEQAGLPPFCLELELTESIAMENPDQALRIIEPLRARGVRFSIDDFGCGHSSLAALTRLPFDVLKIDQQFVRGLERDRHAPAMIETILAMAATLNLDVVAEGVEQEREAQFLRRRGCIYGQGFLFGAPEPAAVFGERLRAQASGLRPVYAGEQDIDAA
ncbi:MAG: EAL domain-containing protein [Alphaproteobacteria bacterium]|nr:EAL domain-containing protein [Alphaproteobacteria bacterium]